MSNIYKESYKGLLEGKVVLLNAPKSAGKDTLANWLVEATGAHKGQFKDQLYVIASAVFNIPLERLIELATDTVLKEEPTQELRGYSPRQALILVSEVMVKPVLGKDYFGQVEKEKLPERTNKGVVYSDSGFPEETTPLIEGVGHENTFVVKFTRQGVSSFQGDSRGWLPEVPGVRVLMTSNDGPIEQLGLRVINWLKGEGASGGNSG